MTEHRVTGSAVTRDEKHHWIVVTLTCSCGKSLRGRGRKLGNAERWAEIAWLRHKGIPRRRS